MRPGGDESDIDCMGLPVLAMRTGGGGASDSKRSYRIGHLIAPVRERLTRLRGRSTVAVPAENHEIPTATAVAVAAADLLAGSVVGVGILGAGTAVPIAAADQLAGTVVGEGILGATLDVGCPIAIPVCRDVALPANPV